MDFLTQEVLTGPDWTWAACLALVAILHAGIWSRQRIRANGSEATAP